MKGNHFTSSHLSIASEPYSQLQTDICHGPLGRSAPCCTPPNSMFTQCSWNQCPSVIALNALPHHGSTLFRSNTKGLLHLIKFGLKRDLERAHLFSHFMLLTQEPSRAHLRHMFVWRKSNEWSRTNSSWHHEINIPDHHLESALTLVDLLSYKQLKLRMNRDDLTYVYICFSEEKVHPESWWIIYHYHICINRCFANVPTCSS